jgi:primary-amine oxidase
MAPHPLQNISDVEVSKATGIVKKLNSGRELWFKSVSLAEPPKSILLPYLDAEAAGVPVSQRPFVPRCIEVIWSADNELEVNVSVISLDSDTEIQRSGKPKGSHGANDRFEVKEASEQILKDPRVLALAKELGLPDETIITCDPWMYGADKFSDKSTPKLIQSLLYARAPNNHTDSNQYAFPLPFSALYDLHQKKVVRLDPLASGGKEDGLNYHTGSSKPMAHCAESEYYHEILKGGTRQDVKPLHVMQPDGPSFTVTDGNCVSWQKWRFRVGFNYREGLTLHDIRYEGRPIFYRLSVSEMTVPYGGKCPFSQSFHQVL